mmetsp:Transcript_98800/g.247653  ORF Transcript_98800/g.247653 Transcript_98800/m.247653 type:complete len:686 (-) Transcript_98800:40-2097(-)
MLSGPSSYPHAIKDQLVDGSHYQSSSDYENLADSADCESYSGSDSDNSTSGEACSSDSSGTSQDDDSSSGTWTNPSKAAQQIDELRIREVPAMRARLQAGLARAGVVLEIERMNLKEVSQEINHLLPETKKKRRAELTEQTAELDMSRRRNEAYCCMENYSKEVADFIPKVNGLAEGHEFRPEVRKAALKAVAALNGPLPQGDPKQIWAACAALNACSAAGKGAFPEALHSIVLEFLLGPQDRSLSKEEYGQILGVQKTVQARKALRPAESPSSLRMALLEAAWLQSFDLFLGHMHEKTPDAEADAAIQSFIEPLLKHSPDKLQKFWDDVIDMRVANPKSDGCSGLLDTGLPVIDVCVDIVQFFMYLQDRQFKFMWLCLSGMAANTVGTAVLAMKAGGNSSIDLQAWRLTPGRLALMNLASLGAAGAALEAHACRGHFKSNALFWYKFLEGLESGVSFMVGAYSLEISGHVQTYESLHGLRLKIRWAGVALSVVCLAKLGRDLTMRIAFRSGDRGSRTRVMLRSQGNQRLLGLFHLSEVLCILSLIPFAFAFRPYGIFMYLGVLLLVWTCGLAVHLCRLHTNYWSIQWAFIFGMIFLTVPSLFMNPFWINRPEFPMRQAIFVGKPVVFLSALTSVGVRALQDKTVPDAVWDTELWTSPVLLSLSVLGLVGYLAFGLPLWRQGFFD